MRSAVAPVAETRRMPRTWKRGPEHIASRFFAKVRLITEHEHLGCWEWTSATYPSGYGIFYDTKVVSAHRWAFARWRGPIPEGHDLDHLCRHRRCVNPWHLEPVTRHENIMRGAGPAVTAERNRRAAKHVIVRFEAST